MPDASVPDQLACRDSPLLERLGRRTPGPQSPARRLPSSRTQRLRMLRLKQSRPLSARFLPVGSQLDSQFIQHLRPLAPVCFDLYEQFEVAAMPQQLFNLAARAYPNLFQALTAAANDDLLLRSPLDEDGAVNAREVCAYLFKPFSHDGGDIRNLFARNFENFLADNLGRK